MKIGHLNGTDIALIPHITYTRVGGISLLPPEGDLIGWGWQTHLATGIEAHISLDQEVFLSVLTVSLGSESRLERAEVLNAEGVCIGSYFAERDKDFGGRFDIEVGERGRNFILRLMPTITDTVIEALDLYGAIADEVCLYPSPARVEWRADSLECTRLASVWNDGHPDSDFARSYFTELAKKRWNTEVSEGDGLRISMDRTLPADAYCVEISKDAATLCASTRLGLLYGIERLLELEKDGALPCCSIEDIPYKEMRGVHLFLPSRAQMGFAKSLLKNMLIPLHYNQIIIEFAGAMRFDSHPEISEGWLRVNRLAREGKLPPFPHGSVADSELLEKDEVRELCDYARELGFELIPEIQSFGHVQYITYVHPDIAEMDPEQKNEYTDARDADVPPNVFYKHSYCPQNEKSYAIIHDLIDEIVEVVRPQRFVHMGHDEIYQLGLCPKCKNVPKDVLYEMHVTDLHAYLAKKGLRMMLWADMVQPVTKYQCYPALDRLPRDIVWLDFIWYFHIEKDTEENLLDKGLQVMIGNLYSSHYPRYEHRVAKNGMLGGQVSFWVPTDERSLGWEGKLYDLLYTAEMLWSRGYCEKARLLYADLIGSRLTAVRNRLRDQTSMTVEKPLDFLKSENVLFYDKIKGVLLRTPLEIKVGRHTDGLRFTHTTLYRERRVAWRDPVYIGTYLVRYEDDTELEIPVEYGVNIRCYRDRFGDPLKEKYYRHEGYVCAWAADPVDSGHTPDGGPITLYAFEWRNPWPEKSIVSVTCTECTDSAAGLLLCGIDLMQN